MAPRNKRSIKTKATQKRNIAARLMKISLTVDDYIYKKLPIHLENAKAYAEEISSYNPLCKGDARSLQVIEKLTLFMKAIIENQEELSVNNSSKDTSQVHSEKYTAADIAPEIAIPNLPISDEQKQCPNNDMVNISCQNPTEASDVRNNNLLENDIDLNRTLSNLSINCLGDSVYNCNTTPQCATVKDATDECEEKIKSLVEPAPLKAVETSTGSSTCTGELKEISSNQQPDPQDVKVCSAKTNEVDTIYLTKNSPVILPLTSIDSNSSQRIASILKNINELKNDNLIKSTDTLNQMKKKFKNKDTVKVKNDTTIKQTKRRKSTHRNRKKKENTAPYVKKARAKRKRSVKPAKGKKNKEHENINSVGVKARTSYKTKKKVDSDKLQEMDLEWVEKIRYVRDINTAEFDTTLNILDNSFWINLSLPSNWDNHSFD